MRLCIQSIPGVVLKPCWGYGPLEKMRQLIRFWSQKVKGQGHIITAEASNTRWQLVVSEKVHRVVLNYKLHCS